MRKKFITSGIVTHDRVDFAILVIHRDKTIHTVVIDHAFDETGHDFDHSSKSIGFCRLLGEKLLSEE